jgi:hypothetical protein
MTNSTVYMIRCQGIGPVFDEVYTSYPSQEAIDRAHAEDVRRHGTKPDGSKRDLKVWVIPVRLIGDSSELSGWKEPRADESNGGAEVVMVAAGVGSVK